MKELANPKQALLTRQTWKYLVVEFETPSGNSGNSSAPNRIVDNPASGAQPEVDCHVGAHMRFFFRCSNEITYIGNNFCFVNSGRLIPVIPFKFSTSEIE